ncbi:CobQ/CobB/MinD/ParA nucleotide binding domain protein [compost metagenome]
MIAVSGVASGVGVTHTAIAIAHVLASHGYRVATVELVQEATSFERIFSIVEDCVYPEHSRSSYMNINHVYYAKKPSRAEYMRLLTENYDYVVCDLGTSHSTYLQEEFMRADLAILVAPAAEWRREDVLRFVRSSPPMLEREWHCVVPFATSAITGQMQRELSHAVHAIPICEDPFDPEDSMKQAVASLHEQWLLPRRKLHTSITAWLHRRKGKGEG